MGDKQLGKRDLKLQLIKGECPGIICCLYDKASGMKPGHGKKKYECILLIYQFHI
jgi:hypothetical protein